MNQTLPTCLRSPTDLQSPASADDVERKAWRTAALDQPGDLMPVDVVGDGVSQGP